jgi:hypothetical protein
MLEKKTPYLTLEECIARYPRLTASLAWAGYSLTEAGAAIRDYRAGLISSSEAVCWTGGTLKAIQDAYRLRAYMQQYQDPQGYSRTRIRAIRAAHFTTLEAARAREAARAQAEQDRREKDRREYAARIAYYNMVSARDLETSSN